MRILYSIISSCVITPPVKKYERVAKLRLFVEEVRLLFEQSYKAFVAVFFISAAYVVLSWNFANPVMLLVWLAAVWALTLFRYTYNERVLKRLDKYNLDQIIRAKRVVLASVALSGFLWGIIGFAFIDLNSITHMGLTFFVITGMNAGAVSAYAMFPLAVNSFIVLSVLPLGVRFALDTDAPDNWLMILMIVLYAGLLMRLVATYYQKISLGIKIRLENSDLLARLSFASHEFKSPLSAIRGYSEMLLSEDLRPEKTKSFATIIKKSCDYLISLMNNLLELSSVETGKMTIEYDWAEVEDIMDSVIRSVKKHAREKGLKITKYVEADVPDLIYCDRTKVQQIMFNLVNNAIKFTEKGSINIYVSYAKEKERFFVNVRDTGIGISDEFVEKLFVPLYRERRLHGVDGSGLGLALAKGLARVLGGSLDLKSTKVGKGSEFVLQFPAQGLKKKKKPTLDSKSLRNSSFLESKRVLLAEDSDDMRTLYTKVLESVGAKVETCENGEEVTARVQQPPEVDIILMDINMPIMDGFQAARALREKGCKKPIMALTAYSIGAFQEKCKNAGFNDYFEKTSSLERFLRKIYENLNETKTTD